MLTTQILRDKLQQLEPAVLEIKDTSDGCGQSFSITIVSNQFQGKSTIQRHKMVNHALKDQIKQIHAFSQNTFTVEEHQAQKSINK
jgi:stress-induced morphogen